MSDVTDVVDRQVAAYFERDLEGFLACYAPETKITDLEGNVLMDLEGMRERYGTLFRESTNLTGRIANRIVVGDIVVDEEQIHGLNLPDRPGEIHAAVSYHVAGGKIDRVVFLNREALHPADGS